MGNGKRGRPRTEASLASYFDGPDEYGKYECRRCAQRLSQSGAYHHVALAMAQQCSLASATRRATVFPMDHDDLHVRL